MNINSKKLIIVYIFLAFAFVSSASAFTLYIYVLGVWDSTVSDLKGDGGTVIKDFTTDVALPVNEFEFAVVLEGTATDTFWWELENITTSTIVVATSSPVVYTGTGSGGSCAQNDPCRSNLFISTGSYYVLQPNQQYRLKWYNTGSINNTPYYDSDDAYVAILIDDTDYNAWNGFGDDVILFDYPSSSEPYHPQPTQFLLHAENLSDDRPYKVIVEYYIESGATTTQTFVSTVGGTGAEFEYEIIVPWISIGVDFQYDTTLYATAYLYDHTDPLNPNASLAYGNLVAEQTVSTTMMSVPNGDFKRVIPRFLDGYGSTLVTSTKSHWAHERPILPTGDVPCEEIALTSTFLGLPFFASSTFARVQCEVFEMVNDVGSGIESGLTTVEEEMMKVFPFNIKTTIESIINHGIDYLDDNPNETLNITGQGDVLSGRSYEIFTTSTVDDIIPNGSDFDFRDLVAKFMYVITGAMIITSAVAIAIKSFS